MIWSAISFRFSGELSLKRTPLNIRPSHSLYSTVPTGAGEKDRTVPGDASLSPSHNSASPSCQWCRYTKLDCAANSYISCSRTEPDASSIVEPNGCRGIEVQRLSAG